MEEEFRLSVREGQLLDEIVSCALVSAQCIGSSRQSAVPEPGIFCQAVVFETANSELAVKPASRDFGDVEVFWLSVVLASDSDFRSDFRNMSSISLAGRQLGALLRWEAIPFTIQFARKEAGLMTARLDFGLLFHFEAGRRLLVLTAPLPFFIQCFTDAGEIDRALASIATT
jgi:hypothetical protein